MSSLERYRAAIEQAVRLLFENYMNIQNFSRLTNISAHTIRYYEKVGLIRQIERNSSGHRYFTQKDVLWVEFIKRLKDTGMPLKQILKYAELRDVENENTIL